MISLPMPDFMLNSSYMLFLIFITTLQGRCQSPRFTDKKSFELFPNFAIIKQSHNEHFKSISSQVTFLIVELSCQICTF